MAYPSKALTLCHDSVGSFGESCSRLLPKRPGPVNIPGARRSSSQTQSSRDLKKHKKPLFRKFLVQPHLEEWIKSGLRERMEERFRLYWRKRKEEPRKPATPLSGLKFNSVREPTSEEGKTGSLTQQWLSYFSFDGTVVPKRFSQVEFPGEDVPGDRHLPRASRKRTKEDRQRVEAVLTTPIPPLAEYVSPDMMDMIKHSPLIKCDEDAVVFRSHRHQTRGQNSLECYRLLSRFLRNVASEIVYREQRVAADEKMYRAEGAIDDPETVILSAAQTKAMAWNVKKPFNLQLKQFQKKAKNEARSKALLPPPQK